MVQSYTPDYNNINTNDFKPIPKGKYLATCTRAEETRSTDERSIFYNLSWRIEQGDHKGRIIFGTIMESSHSTEAVDISKVHLNTICKACALGATGPVNLPRELEGCTVMVYVKQVTYKDKDGNMVLKNEVAGYYDEIPDLTNSTGSANKAENPRLQSEDLF